MVVLVNTLAPAISIFVLHRRGMLSDLDIRNRKERSLPFFIVLAYFIMTYILLVTSPAIFIPLIYLDMWMGLMASIGLALAITSRFKISMHMLGQGGTLGTIMGVQAFEHRTDVGGECRIHILGRFARVCSNRDGRAPSH